MACTTVFMCTLHFYINTFWATVYKMVRPVISDRCLSCPVLTVTFVYCEQTVGWIKMPLGVEVVLDPGHTALNGDPAPPMEMATTAPLSKFADAGFACVYTSRPMSIVAKRLDGSGYHLVRR